MSVDSPIPALTTGTQPFPLTEICSPVRLDARTAVDLKDAAIRAAGNGPVLVLIDVSAVSAIDASGVVGILEVLRAVRSRGGDVRLHGASASLEAVRFQAHLGQIARIYGTRDQAMRGGAGSASTPERHRARTLRITLIRGMRSLRIIRP
jgi:anti-anti-sigma regulatory factor